MHKFIGTWTDCEVGEQSKPSLGKGEEQWMVWSNSRMHKGILLVRAMGGISIRRVLLNQVKGSTSPPSCFAQVPLEAEVHWAFLRPRHAMWCHDATHDIMTSLKEAHGLLQWSWRNLAPAASVGAPVASASPCFPTWEKALGLLQWCLGWFHLNRGCRTLCAWKVYTSSTITPLWLVLWDMWPMNLEVALDWK